ncbi:hypothetical protein DICPUDRAFT_154016, partial [Dictyostelium purpureum]
DEPVDFISKEKEIKKKIKKEEEKFLKRKRNEDDESKDEELVEIKFIKSNEYIRKNTKNFFKNFVKGYREEVQNAIDGMIINIYHKNKNCGHLISFKRETDTYFVSMSHSDNTTDLIFKPK